MRAAGTALHVPRIYCKRAYLLGYCVLQLLLLILHTVAAPIANPDLLILHTVAAPIANPEFAAQAQLFMSLTDEADDVAVTSPRTRARAEKECVCVCQRE